MGMVQLSSNSWLELDLRQYLGFVPASTPY